MRKIQFFAALTLLAILSTLATARISIDTITISPDPAKYNEDFRVTAKLSGVDESQCSVEAKFYINDFAFQTINAKCGAREVDATWSQNEWDKFNLKCGVNMARVELKVEGGLVDNYTQSVDIGVVPDVSFNPLNPTVDREFTITFRDPEDQSLITNMNVKIETLLLDSGTKVSSASTTASSGQISYTTKNPGKYTAIVSKRQYCGEIDFYIKKQMMIDGPRPANPVIGEPISIGVPAGSSVGIRILDPNGNFYQSVPVSLSGGANFTINEPGNYTIVIGEISPKYWPVNKSLMVYSRPVPEISIYPDEPAVGKPVTISVMSRGVGLEGATVTVTKPDGVSKEFITGSDGGVTYDSVTSVGRYTVRAEKDRHDIVTQTFDTYYSFSANLDPINPTVNDTITLSVQNNDGVGVGDAMVLIPSIGYVGYTDNQGKLRLSLQEPKDYELFISKARYWNITRTVSPFGILGVEMSSYDIELGASSTIMSKTLYGKALESDIKITGPDGITRTTAGSSYVLTPDSPGVYRIILEKRNYLPANATLNVKPHPVDFSSAIVNGKFIVNVTSHGAGVDGLKVSVAMAGWSADEITNSAGVASFPVRGGGLINVTVNSGGIRAYEAKGVAREIVKSYKLQYLVAPVTIIVLLSLFIIIALQLFKGGGGGSVARRIREGGSAFKRTSQRLSRL